MSSEQTICPGCGGLTIGGYRCHLCTSEDRMYAAPAELVNPYGLGGSMAEAWRRGYNGERCIAHAGSDYDRAWREGRAAKQAIPAPYQRADSGFYGAEHQGQPATPRETAGPASVGRPLPGTFWEHQNGNRYEVLYLANEHTQDAQRYPVTVVYRGVVNGLVWARAADDWHRSMTQVHG